MCIRDSLWLEHYGYDEGDPTKQFWKDSQAVWFDDVVVAKRYIGPMEKMMPEEGKELRSAAPLLAGLLRLSRGGIVFAFRGIVARISRGHLRADFLPPGVQSRAQFIHLCRQLGGQIALLT